VKHPLQAYFRINAENFGQFERTLIIADERSEVMYMEGCTAPNFTTATLHAAAVELVALPPAKIQYVTVQNWSTNLFNLVTKPGLAMEEAEVEWIVREHQSRCMVVDPLSAIVKAGAALTAGRVAERCAPAPLGLF
jgi:Fe-S cluster assembly scaffold protein SufB